MKTLEVDGSWIKLQIWDTAGQAKYKSITESYYRGTQGIIFVFDKTCRKSFDNISMWYEEVSKTSTKSVKILVGTKSDLREKYEVGYDLAQQYASNNNMNYMETSARNSHQIYLIFEILARSLIQNCYNDSNVRIPMN